jgi:hypothetical protein
MLGLPAARMLIATSTLMTAYVVFGIETADGVFELIRIEVDP